MRTIPKMALHNFACYTYFSLVFDISHGFYGKCCASDDTRYNKGDHWKKHCHDLKINGSRKKCRSTLTAASRAWDILYMYI